jgi:probable selenium-dependent hydroxylase accessory protein YqeC
MNLPAREGKGSLICFTGGGGKTTLMLRLARYLRPCRPVIVTTTTRMASSEISSKEKLTFLFRELKNGKYYGFTPHAVASFYRRSKDACVLVEADGARRMPLKGYAAHEPPLPDMFDYQMIVVGVDAFLQPMNEQTVARFEIVQRFLGINTNEMLTPPFLLKLLTSPDMYMKNSPSETKRILCLNKADLMDSASLASWTNYLRSRLDGYYGISITGRGMKEAFINTDTDKIIPDNLTDIEQP